MRILFVIWCVEECVEIVL